MRYLFTVSLCLTVSFYLSAQCPGKSPYWGLNCFLSSDFIQQFEAARTRAEQSVSDFKALAIAENFSETDIERVMDAYNASANRFNDVLYDVKDDLLDKVKRRRMLKDPEAYSAQMEVKLQRAADFYANSYGRVVDEVTGSRVQASAFLALLPEIIKYVKTGIALFKKVKKEVRKYNEELIDRYLIEEYRFRSWDEAI